MICDNKVRGSDLKHSRAYLICATLAFAAALCVCMAACNSGQLSQETPQKQMSTQTSAQAPEQSFEQEPEEPDYVFPAQNRTWIVLGDSLTDDTFRAKTKYYDYVAQDLGCTVVNCGMTGTGYMTPTDGDAFCDRVDNIDVSNADCLTIFGSFNDLGKGFYLGSAYDETTDTIGGCMNITIEKLVAKNPSLRIGIVTPTPWRTNFSYNDDGTASFETVSRYDCDAYVELLKEVAKRHRLPVLDLYETCGLDPDNEQVRELYFTYNGKTDEGGVHPNSEGHKLMYPQWREFVLTLLASDNVE